MSVIVKNMEMPIMCTDCNLNYYGQGDNYACCYCSITDKEIDYIARHPDCPLEDTDDGWIPCSERLPDKYGWYLCTLKDGRVNCYYWNNKGEWLDNGKKHFFELYNIYGKLTGREILAKNEGSVYWTDWVIAWRPLPKPYQLKEDKHNGRRKNL